MNEQEIIGNHISLIFYYPVGAHLLYSQVYYNNTEDVLEENPVYDQRDYDFVEMMIKATDNKISDRNNMTRMFV